MTKQDFVVYCKAFFQPLTLAITDDVIMLLYDRCVLYWNNNSAHRIMKMFTITSNPVAIDNEFKDICEVFPAAQQNAVTMADPTWQLLGIQLMSTITADFVTLNEGYKNYIGYFGVDFRWWFEANQDPTGTGELYLQRTPATASSVAVVGTKRILSSEDIKNSYVLDWMQRALIAQIKMSEGNILRKAEIINVKNDGQQMIDEGKEEWEKLREELAVNSRWFALAKRI